MASRVYGVGNGPERQYYKHNMRTLSRCVDLLHAVHAIRTKASILLILIYASILAAATCRVVGFTFASFDHVADPSTEAFTALAGCVVLRKHGLAVLHLDCWRINVQSRYCAVRCVPLSKIEAGHR